MWLTVAGRVVFTTSFYSRCFLYMLSWYLAVQLKLGRWTLPMRATTLLASPLLIIVLLREMSEMVSCTRRKDLNRTFWNIRGKTQFQFHGKPGGVPVQPAWELIRRVLAMSAAHDNSSLRKTILDIFWCPTWQPSYKFFLLHYFYIPEDVRGNPHIQYLPNI